MPFESSWRVEERIIYIRFWGDTTLKDAEEFNAHLIEMLEQGTPPVHLIIDLRELKSTPNDFRNLSKIIKFPLQQIGWVMNVGMPNPVLGFIAAALAQLFGARMRSVKTIAEAEQFLAEQESQK
jgi:hypothetical protein